MALAVRLGQEADAGDGSRPHRRANQEGATSFIMFRHAFLPLLYRLCVPRWSVSDRAGLAMESKQPDGLECLNIGRRCRRVDCALQRRTFSAQIDTPPLGNMPAPHDIDFEAVGLIERPAVAARAIARLRLPTSVNIIYLSQRARKGFLGC
jgi:hypothetical protein